MRISVAQSVTMSIAVGVMACLAGMAIGSAPNLPKCQQMVLTNAKGQRAYEAQLSQILNPDFLEALAPKGAK